MRGQSQRLAVRRSGSRIEDEIEPVARNRIERHGLDGTAIANARGKLARALARAVGDHERARACTRAAARSRRAPRRPRRARGCARLAAHAQVAREIGHEARAVGVVGVDRAAARGEEIRRARERRARSACVAARSNASTLKGSVTFAPRPPPSKNRRADRSELVRAARAASCTRSPRRSARAKRAWIAGERLWATGLPITA